MQCAKDASLFELSLSGVLYYVGSLNQRKTKAEQCSLPNGVGIEDDLNEFRLVIPTTLIPDILSNTHRELQGGHQGILRTYLRVKKLYYWLNMYADVERYVSECEDCWSGKGKPKIRGHSPGNLLANRPFQIVSMDFVVPLPRSHRKNTALLLFQCAFSGYVMCKSMANTEALEVAKAFFKVVFQRFGACEVLRHDRDPRFMGQVFTEFNKMLGQRQRVTLSYRPQANGQRERSVRTVMQSVEAYISDPEQRGWDTLAESLMFALNTAYDRVRQETPYFLVHGWDTRSTISVMVSSLASRKNGSPVATKWRRETICRHERAQQKAWELQRYWKKKQARPQRVA